MILTADILAKAVGCSVERAALFVDHLSAACAHYNIDTPKRLAAFLAQVGHESGSLRHTVEVWGPTPAQNRYEGRRDLGNVQPGDGSRFRGRGLIQLTGRYNHAAVRDRLWRRGVACPDFEATPESLAEAQWAAWSAADFWDWKQLNGIADYDDFTRITQIINGGQNGREDRERRWARAKEVLFAQDQTSTVATLPEVAQKENDMPLPALLAALAPMFVSKIPEMIEIATASDKDERKAKAVELAINVATEAVGARNAQEAAEMIESNPDAAERARAAVRAEWFRIQEISEKSVSLARDHAMKYSQLTDVRTVAGRFTFIEFLTLVLIGTSWVSIGLLAAFDKISKETLDNIVMIAAVATIVGAREFWMGSSAGSRQKDEMRQNEVKQ